MDSIKKSHYTRDLLANGRVKLRFEGRDERRLRAQNRQRLDEEQKDGMKSNMTTKVKTMTTMKRKDKNKDGRTAVGTGENIMIVSLFSTLTQTLLFQSHTVISFTSFEKF